MPLFTFLLSFFTTYATRGLAEFIGAIDKPDGIRRLQPKPVAKLGGISIYVAAVVALFICGGADEPLPLLIIFGGGATMLFGICDDVFSYSPTKKLAAEYLIAHITAFCAAQSLGAKSELEIIAEAALITMLVNAYNLIDGTDGLCATLSLVALLFLATRDQTAYLLFFATLGFLPQNIPAKIYLGESGAAFLGFSIAALLLYGGFGKEGIFVAAIPIIELISTFIRRVAGGKSPFSSDRLHLHHILLDSGVSAYGVALIFAAFSILFSLGSLIVS